MLKYEIRKNEYGDILGCECCDSEVPVCNFLDEKYLCEFCASSFGRRGDTLTKEMLAQMLNVLRYSSEKVQE